MLQGDLRTGQCGKGCGVRSMAIRDMGVEQIEKAISQLPARELAELVAWLEDYHAQVWDKRIEEDLEAGRLDKVLAEVDAEHEAGLAELL